MIVDAWIENDSLLLLSPSFERLEVPLAKLARSIGANKSKISAFEIDEEGSFLYWPHADVHLGWDQFRQVVDPTALLPAMQRTQQFNKRYGAAIRSLRTAKGLTQSDVAGVTDRQLRRVESGLQAASKRVLESLAQAHQIPLDQYLSTLAKQMAAKERKSRPSR